MISSKLKPTIAILALALAPVQAFAGDGHGGGNGGGGVAIEFKSIAHNLVHYFRSLNAERRPEIFNTISLERFATTAKTSKVIPVLRFSVETPTDRMLSAKNYPPTSKHPGGVIEVNVTSWKIDDQKPALVFHEILGLLGVDRNYEVTHDFYDFSYTDTQRFLRDLTTELSRVFEKASGFSRKAIGLRIWDSASTTIEDENGNVKRIYSDISGMSVCALPDLVRHSWKYNIEHYDVFSKAYQGPGRERATVTSALARLAARAEPAAQWSERDTFDCSISLKQMFAKSYFKE